MIFFLEKVDVLKQHLNLKIEQHGHRIILLIHQLEILDHWKHVPVSEESILLLLMIFFFLFNRYRSSLCLSTMLSQFIMG